MDPTRPTPRGLARYLFSPTPRCPLSPAQKILNSALLLLAAGGTGVVLLRRSSLVWDWGALAPYWKLFLEGWRTTVCISLCALLLSTLLGGLLAWATRARFIPTRLFAQAYIELIRGTPLLAQIYVFFYIVAEAARLENRFIAGTLILSLFSSAYLAEILRGGLESIGRSQLDSAKALGLTPLHTYRYVILPQALRAVLPPLAGQFVSLIKDSSLLSIIGLNELTQNAKNVASYTFSNFESYLLLSLGYLLLTLPISLWTRSLEKRLRYES
jgi:polar amino acid transport system permease protein